MGLLEEVKEYMEVNNVKQIDIVNKFKEKGYKMSKSYFSRIYNGKHRPKDDFFDKIEVVTGMKWKLRK